MGETAKERVREMTPEERLKNHLETSEPLDEEEVKQIVAAGLATEDDFDMRGGGLWWHVSIPEPQD